MKQKLQNILFLFLLGTMGVRAQGPVITSEGVNLKVGDVLRLQNTKSISTIPSLSGANKVWDFSNLKDSGSAEIVSFISPKGLPYADSFPTSNIAIIDSGWVEFDQADSNGYGEVGYYSWDTITGMENSFERFKPRLPFFVFPLSINTNYTDSIQEYYRSGTYEYNYSGADTIKGIGYGTLKLPNATYDSVLCIYHYGYWFLANGTHFVLMALSPVYDASQNMMWKPIYNIGKSLPIQISSFTASWQNKLPYLQWNAANTENTKAFNIQRSAGGNSFRNIGQVTETNGNAYHFTDNYTPANTVYYRLQQIDKAGKFFYSNTARLTVNGQRFAVYPNPAKGSIHLSIPSGSQVTVMVYNVAGKLVYENKNLTAADAITTSTWSKGTYTVRIKDNSGWQVSSFEKE